MAKILIVDDTEDNLHLIMRIVQHMGHRTIMAHDGIEALDHARREQPDLILMDLLMPGLDGFEATKQLKADPILADIPVIALTALALERDRSQALAVGCEGFITKPIDFGLLYRTVDQFVQRVPAAA